MNEAAPRTAMPAAELDAVWHDGIAAAAEAERTHAPAGTPS
jgi:hypothetical protein